MNMVRKEYESDDFTVEPYMYRNRKNIMSTYKGFQILEERKFEVFMNLILFRNIISKVWTEEFSQEVLICLVRAGMVLTNIKIWRDFIISRDTNIGKTGGSNINIRSKQHRTLTIGRSKGKHQLGKLEKTRFVKTAEVESKKEEPAYDSDVTVSAEEVDLNLANPILISTQIVNSEYKANPKSDYYSKGQEIIRISSDSEHENIEQKIDS